MPKQVFNDKKRGRVIDSKHLEFGQLGEIVDDFNYNNGIIITKTFNSFVALYIPEKIREARRPFECVWSLVVSFKVRLLEEGESITLSN